MKYLPPRVYPPSDICSLLTRLGLKSNYIGFFHTAFALELALQEPAALCMVTKWIYPAVARRCKTSPAAVERNIRLTSDRVWASASDRLSALAGVPLTRRPANAVFLAILHRALLEEGTQIS